MRGHAAGPEPPFDGGVRKAQAIFSGGKLLDLLTISALLHDRMAATSIKLAPILVHKKTFKPYLYAFTNHGYHVLSVKFSLTK